ncbi:MATE family efflux transporter [Formosa sp. 4Alg 33]|uniref:MATE family efflux transporter n=1 Tax=Formosa sp. 4Alg 33 TaxID=3382189 RepID=UPI003D9C018B
MKFKYKELDQISLNSLQIIFIKGFGIILSYGLTLFLTNYFSEKSVGEFNFSNNILLIFGTICLFGANQSIYQIGGKMKGVQSLFYLKKIYFKFLLISFYIFLIILITVLIIPEKFYDIVFNKPDVYSLTMKTILYVFIYALTIINFEMLRILKFIKTSELFRSVFRPIVFFIAAVVVYFIGKSYLLVDIFLFSFLVIAIVSTAIILKKIKQAGIKQEEDNESYSIKNIFIVSLPMAVSALSLLLMQSIDSFFIIKYYSYAELAYYAIAIKLTVLITVVLTSINTVIAPEISKSYFENNFVNLKEVIYKSSRINFIFTIPLLLILVVFSDFILNMFGENYVVAKVALIVLCVGQFVSSYCGSVGLYLNMTGKQKQFFLLLLISLALNFLLNFILIPKYGINGAAISSSFSLIFWNIVGLIYIYKVDKVKTYFRR